MFSHVGKFRILGSMDIYNETFEQQVKEICQQIIHSNIAYGESAVLVGENGCAHVLTLDELNELHENYDLSQLKPVDLDK